MGGGSGVRKMKLIVMSFELIVEHCESGEENEEGSFEQPKLHMHE